MKVRSEFEQFLRCQLAVLNTWICSYDGVVNDRHATWEERGQALKDKNTLRRMADRVVRILMRRYGGVI